MSPKNRLIEFKSFKSIFSPILFKTFMSTPFKTRYSAASKLKNFVAICKVLSPFLFLELISAP